MQALAFWHSALPLNLPERLAELLADGLDGAGSWVRRWVAGARSGRPASLLAPPAETSLSSHRSQILGSHDGAWTLTLGRAQHAC
jgi:hypothetical protein